MDDASFRQVIRDALNQWNVSTEEAIRRELAKSFDLGHSGRLQFEIDDMYNGIWLIQTEGVVLEHDVWDAIPRSLPEEVESAGNDPFRATADELVQWFADRWCACGGPTHYSPAYAFFHFGGNQPRFDLEKRRWYSVEEVWPE